MGTHPAAEPPATVFARGRPRAAQIRTFPGGGDSPGSAGFPLPRAPLPSAWPPRRGRETRQGSCRGGGTPLRLTAPWSLPAASLVPGVAFPCTCCWDLSLPAALPGHSPRVAALRTARGEGCPRLQAGGAWSPRAVFAGIPSDRSPGAFLRADRGDCSRTSCVAAET